MMKIFAFYKKLIIENKNWILASILIYFSGFLLGSIIALAYPDLAEKTLKALIESFQKRGLLEPEISPLTIFSTNSYALLLSMGLGIILGLPTTFLILSNGFILGVIFSLGATFKALFLSIAPHGIFEYPAMFIGAGFGLKFGLSYLNPKVKEKKKEFKRAFVELLAITPLVLALLLIAAFVEAKITPFILCNAKILCL